MSVTSTVQNQDELQIRQLMDQQETAMKAEDADYLVSRYTPDVVAFSLAPPLRQAVADIRSADGLSGWFATFEGPVDFEITELRVTVGGDVAFCSSLNRMSAMAKGQTEKFDLWFRSTVCWQKIDGRWQLAHEHQSTPFYMDDSFTFKAAVDLRP